jgi:hypothetical protein
MLIRDEGVTTMQSLSHVCGWKRRRRGWRIEFATLAVSARRRLVLELA